MTRDGYNIVRWSQGGMVFRAVSDVEAAQLAEFARLWRGGREARAGLLERQVAQAEQEHVFVGGWGDRAALGGAGAWNVLRSTYSYCAPTCTVP